MKISGVEIRPGNNIEYDGSLWRAVKIQHTQPGKGGAYMQVELKNLIDGRKNNVRFRSAETVERIRLDTKDFQYLYAEGDMLVFMDTETYEQINLPQDLVGDASAFLQDGMMVMLLVAAPMLLTGLVVGLSISIFQTLTHIQEMTLTFIPKILAVFAALIIFLPWMLRELTEFYQRIMDKIVALG